MLARSEAEIAREWSKYQGYTIRPLPSTISYYREIIRSQAAESRFLLYGGTPELRSIFQSLNYPLTMVDRSEQMVRAMGLLTENRQPLSSNENFKRHAWLKMTALEQSFDVLLGDDAINMVSWPEFELFLQQAWQCLRPGGLFVCHLLVKPSAAVLEKNFSDLESEFRRGELKSIYDLASRLNFLCWDPHRYALGWQKTILQLGKERLARFKPELDFIETFGCCNSQFFCPPIQDFERLVEDYFTIKEIFYPHEHDYCLFEPVYVLERK
jgi:SAM-dependent methyltransferase